MNKVLKRIAAVLLFCGACFSFSLITRAEAATVVLDPGHDSTHAGANANGLAEETINYKIARYCMQELQQYPEINVYITRNGEGCPYPGTTSTSCNKKRVEFAKSVGADVFVSIHNNASSSTAARGASVYYPNANYNTPVSVAGQRLSQLVLNRLTSLGLANRGTLIRNSEDNTLYPDGTLADYYGVIKNSKLSGFAGIIIEHAFVTSPEDVSSFLSTDAKLKLLGIADATAIAEYFGLSKGWDHDTSKAGFITSFSSDYKTAEISLTGITGAPAVKIAVWSMNNGQDDLVWYDAVQDASGNWSINVPLSAHKSDGEYAINAYVDDGGQSYPVKSTSLWVEGPSGGNVSVTSLNEKSGVFKVQVKGAAAKAGLSQILVSVWNNDDRSDLITYQASKEADDIYEVNAAIADYKYADGTYNIEAYAVDANGIQTLQDSCKQVISRPKSKLELSLDDSQSLLQIHASDLPYADDIVSVRASVWSVENGQDDLAEYEMTNENDWAASVFLTNHLTSNDIMTQVYAIMKNGTSVLLSEGSILPSAAESYIHSAKSEENGIIRWDGKNISIEADANLLKLPDMQQPENVSSPGAVAAFADGNTNQDVVTVSQNAATVTSNAAEASKNAVELKPDAAFVSSDALLYEKIYTLADDMAFLNQVNALLKQNETRNVEGFYVTDALLLTSEQQPVLMNGSIKLNFHLPSVFTAHNIEVYALDEKDGQVTLGQQLEMTVTPEGDIQIMTERLGTFAVVSTDSVQNNILYGDVDFDNQVTLNDCMIVLKAALGIDALRPDQMAAADIDQDGSINLTDAKIILEIALGIRTQ